jgi:transcriptional regulator with XRE-family HTH domain
MEMRYSESVLSCKLFTPCYFTYTAMEADGLTRSSGAKRKQLRDRLGLTLREVEARSRKLAEEEKSQDYFVSRGWLNNVENSSLTPSIYKIYALGVIYHENWSNILAFFGLRVADIGRDQALFGFPNTRLMADSDEPEIPVSLVVPVRVREDLQLEKTNLLTRLRGIWGEIPVPLLQHLELKKFVYGYVGLQDFTRHPLVRPGSFVQIDESQRKIRSGTWQNEFERPIYFIELRGAYLCSWCEIKEGHLLSIPYSTSPCEIRRVPYPREAEIVGRVIGVTMRIADAG